MDKLLIFILYWDALSTGLLRRSNYVCMRRPSLAVSKHRDRVGF